MSYRHINAARDVEGLDLTAKAVLVLISTYTNEAGLAWCAQETIAWQLGCHPVTISRAVGRIRKVVPLTVTRRHGLSSRYDFTALLSPPRSAKSPPAPALSTPRAAALCNHPSGDIAPPLFSKGGAAAPDEDPGVPPAATESEITASKVHLATARAALNGKVRGHG